MKTNAMRILDANGIEYAVKDHGRPALTAEEAARERGVRINQIVKAMLVIAEGGQYALVLAPGHRKISLRKVGRYLGEKVKLANQDEVSRITGYKVGSVAPVGVRHKNLSMLFDPSILEEEWVDISSGNPLAGIELRSRELFSFLRADLVDICEQRPRGCSSPVDSLVA